MTTGIPLDRTALNDEITLSIYNNATGLIDGDKLQEVLLYLVASVPNLLTDGFLTGNPGAPVNVDLKALLAAIKSKAEQQFVVDGLAGKENKFAGLITSELNPDKSAYAALLLHDLLVKLVNAITEPVDLTPYATHQEVADDFNNRRALFFPLSANQLDADKAAYAGLAEYPLLIKIINALSATTVPRQPAAPTAGQVDDTGDTFSFLPNPLFPSFAQYKVNGLPGVSGAVVLDGVNSYVQGNRIYIRVVGNVAKNGLAVYVAGSGNIPDGLVLTNDDPFTGNTVIVQPGTPNAPTNLRTTGPTSSTIPLAWDAVAGTYTLQRALVDSSGNVGTFATIYTGTTASYQNTGLTYVTTYAYQVKVTVNGVDSPYSTVAQATTASSSPVITPGTTTPTPVITPFTTTAY